MKNIQLHTVLKKLIFLTLISLTVFSCYEDAEPLEIAPGPGTSDTFSDGPICDGKKIFEFLTLDAIQNEHKILYDDFNAGDQNEEILIDYEASKNFYSLRAKDYDMDNGVIPDDPSFDPFDYTSDEILETLLNEDGMVIIGNYLYMWDDGCVIHRMPYNGCTDYSTMLSFKAFADTYSGSTAEQAQLISYRNDDKIEDINICHDYRYDFETISELNFPVDNQHPLPENNDRGTDCGYLTYIEHDVLEVDPIEDTTEIKFTANSIAPMGSSPIYSFYIDNSAQYESITISDASIPEVIGLDWAVLGGDAYVYPGEWFTVIIDYTSEETVPLLDVRLGGVVFPFSGDSCSDSDDLLLNLQCPISMSKKPINAELGEYSFVIEGLEAFGGAYSITWNFGDGSTETHYGVNNVTHQFPVPCIGASTYNVTATLSSGSQGSFCSFSPLQASITTFSPCIRLDMSEKYKVKVDGKNVFRYRKLGTKTIDASGPIFLATGSGCVELDVSLLLSSVSQDGKKRAKQKLTIDNIYGTDLDSPYNVTFTHSNGFSHTLTRANSYFAL